VLLDANLLLYAVDRSSAHNTRAEEWLVGVLRGNSRVGLPWQTLGAFVRIVTNPRINAHPLNPDQAWACVQAWVGAEVCWIPPATQRTVTIFGGLIVRHGGTANLVPDAMLAALAIEHGLTIMSADTDFARFGEARWENPLAG